MPTLSKREQQDAVTLTAARTRVEILRGDILEIDKAVKLGQYVLAKEVEQKLFEYTRQIRDAWQNFVTRNSAVIASELRVDQALCSEVLEKYIRLQLEELSEQQQ